MFAVLHIFFLCAAFVRSSASNGNEKDCMWSSGEEYRGGQDISSSGLICLNWTNTTRDYDVNIHPDSQTGVGDHNSCRNPDSSKKPWCYIAGPDGTVQRQFCAIDTCIGQGPASDCCVHWSNIKVHVNKIVNYTYQSDNRCIIKAIVFYTICGKRICSNPNSTWARRVIKKVDKQTLALQRKGNNEEGITTSITPPMSYTSKNTPHTSGKARVTKGRKETTEGCA